MLRTICTVLFAWRPVHHQPIVPLHTAIVRRGVDFLFFLPHPADLLEADKSEFPGKLLEVFGQSEQSTAPGRGKAIAVTTAVETCSHINTNLTEENR